MSHMQRPNFRFTVATLCVILFARTAPAAPLRVDISPDNGRKDVLTPDVENWLVKDAETVSATFAGGVKVTLRKAGDVGTGIAAILWKGGLDNGVHIAIDGITVKDGDKGGQLEMVLSG